jgi:hypothetical protein
MTAQREVGAVATAYLAPLVRPELTTLTMVRTTVHNVIQVTTVQALGMSISFALRASSSIYFHGVCVILQLDCMHVMSDRNNVVHLRRYFLSNELSTGNHEKLQRWIVSDVPSWYLYCDFERLLVFYLRFQYLFLVWVSRPSCFVQPTIALVGSHHSSF